MTRRRAIARGIPARPALALAALCALAGCSGDRFTGFDLPTSTAAPASAPTASAVPQANLAGRWLFASPGRGQCGMTLRSAGGPEGSVAPEGGCPGKFFTARKWTFGTDGLTLRDHNGQPLAQLSEAGGSRFEGSAATGEPVTLTR